MRVLDLDLDFFLADCCPLAEKGCRPELSGHEPWQPEAVRRFLEEHCGLRKDTPLPGRVFETHDGALDFWLEHAAHGRLTVPFDVTHVDAHSDLGIGYPGPGFVLYNVIAMNPATRRNVAAFRQQNKLDEANYLLFALAMRLIRSLENVREPFSRPDIPRELLTQDGKIHLQSLTSGIFEGRNGPEPVIPFLNTQDPGSFFAAGPYDYVTLAMSPRYAPREADALAEVVREYLVEE